MKTVQAIKDKMQGKGAPGKARSSHWPIVRKAFLARNPTCAVCGGTAKLEAHHIRPFHLDSSLELNEANLIALCENKKDGINCHLAFGHLGNFKSFNVNVVADAAEWNEKITSRPK